MSTTSSRTRWSSGSWPPSRPRMCPGEAAGGPQLSAPRQDAAMTSARDRDMEGVQRALEALRGFDPAGGWEEVRPAVLPLLKRVRHPVPPGIWTGFGIDIGPACAHVSRGLFRGWGIDQATLLGAALENLRHRVLEEPP